MVEFVVPIDGDGEFLPHNHPSLVGGHRIIRRISDDYIVVDSNTGGKRISSALFKNDPRQGYLSIDSETCILDRQVEPPAWVTSPTWRGALVLTVIEFRGCDVAVATDAEWQIGIAPLDENPCHGAVWGKITKGQSNEIQRRSAWLVEMQGVDKLT